MKTLGNCSPSVCLIVKHPFSGAVIVMDLEHLCATWPHSYHVTAGANLGSIRRSRTCGPQGICSSEQIVRRLFIDAGRKTFHSASMQCSVIRNQIPLDPTLLDLGPACTLGEYVACLNSQCFSGRAL